MMLRRTAGAVLIFGLGCAVAAAADRTIAVTSLDAIVAAHPIAPGTASVVAAFQAGKGELEVVVADRIPLHIHDQDHVVFVARGSGTARIENAGGGIDARPVKPGDIIDVPRGRKHAFEKAGAESLVLLVTTPPSGTPPQFFE
jgi:quercetin dioxygenase-like cupin family protein